MKAGKKRRPNYARAIKTQLRPIRSKVDVVRRLTLEIRRIANHLESDPRHWRDARSKLSLEQKINERGEILETICKEAPEMHQEICKEIGR